MALTAIYFVINTTGDEWECRSMTITETLVYPEKDSWNIGGKLYNKTNRHQKWIKKSDANRNQLRAIQKFEKDVLEFQTQENENWSEPEFEESDPLTGMNAKHAQAKMFNNNTFSNGLFK